MHWFVTKILVPQWYITSASNIVYRQSRKLVKPLVFLGISFTDIVVVVSPPVPAFFLELLETIAFSIFE